MWTKTSCFGGNPGLLLQAGVGWAQRLCGSGEGESVRRLTDLPGPILHSHTAVSSYVPDKAVKHEFGRPDSGYVARWEIYCFSVLVHLSTDNPLVRGIMTCSFSRDNGGAMQAQHASCVWKHVITPSMCLSKHKPEVKVVQ